MRAWRVFCTLRSRKTKGVFMQGLWKKEVVCLILLALEFGLLYWSGDLQAMLHFWHLVG